MIILVMKLCYGLNPSWSERKNKVTVNFRSKTLLNSKKFKTMENWSKLLNFVWILFKFWIENYIIQNKCGQTMQQQINASELKKNCLGENFLK